jgi:hypothetical protein
MVRAHLANGRTGAAAQAVLVAYGAELFGFIHAMTDTRRAARAAYTAVADDLVRGLSAFSWRSSLRAWTYALARRALRGARRPREPAFPSAVAVPTTPYRSGSNLPEALRRTLTSEELELLILRVERDLTWDELAVTSLGDGRSFRSLEAEAELLRQRFRRLRRTIVRRASKLGVVSVERGASQRRASRL